MEPDFMVIEFEDIEKNRWKKLVLSFPTAIREIMFKKLWKPELEMKEIGEFSGFSLRLNLSKTTSERFSAMFLEQYIEEAVSRFQFRQGTVLLPVELKKRFSSEFLDRLGAGIELNEGWLWCLMMDVLVEKVRVYRGISKKYVRLAIIDGGGEETFKILPLLIPGQNYVTLITERRQEFETLLDQIYEEEGLLVQVEQKPLKLKIDSQIVVELTKNADKAFYFYGSDACIINPYLPKDEKEKKMERRHDIIYMEEAEISQRGMKIPAPLLSAILQTRDMSDYRKIREKYSLNVRKVTFIR